MAPSIVNNDLPVFPQAMKRKLLSVQTVDWVCQRLGMAWRARHSIWPDLACMAWYTVWHCGHGMVYGKAWRTSHLVYIWPDRHGMLYVMVWLAYDGI